MDVDEIRRILPQRYPFLMVDRVLEWGEGRVRALKNVTVNEPFFVGHFPDRPVMPGVLILEGMAQTVGLLICRDRPRQGYLVSVERARFRRPVTPGDQLIYEAERERERQGFYRARVFAYVNGAAVAEAVLSIAEEQPEQET
ncbi:3-hydroxyacyl-ACP dehydratase FabZ [Candidatus Acetothermia bacterium]|jgi:3-hydroxyacyl-[acyl-carrier-protein] dehydratase|nr:3-hydroxyacyl-ACP dehydratase FabZ [Candidatus Acetothermia bacterium]MCI2432605.1 3-hydroxyacyl-ACP dehydratase FabZ [Candidatus Acetothermia bacterium]MCI2436642.1 3-hydroxyacyl-ACP dehydratase FabZ [Candidatus Acetothermia bacterium]